MDCLQQCIAGKNLEERNKPLLITPKDDLHPKKLILLIIVGLREHCGVRVHSVNQTLDSHRYLFQVDRLKVVINKKPPKLAS